MKTFFILCIIIILACLYQSSIEPEPFFKGSEPDYFTSTVYPCGLSSIN